MHWPAKVSFHISVVLHEVPERCNPSEGFVERRHGKDVWCGFVESHPCHLRAENR